MGNAESTPQHQQRGGGIYTRHQKPVIRQQQQLQNQQIRNFNPQQFHQQPPAIISPQPVYQHSLIQQPQQYSPPQQQPSADLIIRDSSLFAPISLMDVNDRMTRFQQSETEMTQQFENRQKTEREKFNEELQKRRKMFEREIEKFEHSNNDPYTILGLQNRGGGVGITLAEIKAAYKNLARKHHPDKGGNAERFKLITQSYCYLMNKYGAKNSAAVEEHNKMTAPVVNRDYTNVDSNMQNLYVDKDNFDVKKFNDIFNKFKVEDVYDDGYGNIMNNSEEPAMRQIDKNQTVFTDKFNKEVFNKMFENENIHDELIEYNGEPEALDSSKNLSFKELGQGKIADFGKDAKFTDYKRAYEKSRFNPNKVKYKEYRNVDELKRERGSISHEMTDEMREKIRRKEEREAEQERRRKEKLEQEDDLWKVQYEKLNKLFIKN